LGRLIAEIKRRTSVVAIFPNDGSIKRQIGAMMLEQNDEWSLNRRYMQLEGLQTLSDTVPTRLSAVARGSATAPCSQPGRGIQFPPGAHGSPTHRVETGAGINFSE